MSVEHSNPDYSKIGGIKKKRTRGKNKPKISVFDSKLKGLITNELAERAIDALNSLFDEKEYKDYLAEYNRLLRYFKPVLTQNELKGLEDLKIEIINEDKNLMNKI